MEINDCRSENSCNFFAYRCEQQLRGGVEVCENIYNGRNFVLTKKEVCAYTVYIDINSICTEDKDEEE